MKTSKKEIIDLLKAWIAISIAFAIILREGSALKQLSYSFLISIIIVGTSFLLHELAHKALAQKYRLFAEFRSFDLMLLIAIAMSFFGFILAAPGAVMIEGHVTRERNGKISAMGPLTNLALALIFFGIGLLASSGLISEIAYYGTTINTWIGVFNLIPVWNFDGAKILEWNKLVYFGMASLGVLLLFFL